MKPKKCSPVDFLFWLMNSSSSTLMGYCTLTIEFFWLKNHTSYYYINSFSLLWISFFLILSLSLSLSLCCFSQNKQIWKKKKKNKSIWPSLMVGRRTSGGRAANVVMLHGERRSPPALSFWRSDPAFFLSSLSLFLSSLMWSKWGCWNVLKEKKKIKEGG